MKKLTFFLKIMTICVNFKVEIKYFLFELKNIRKINILLIIIKKSFFFNKEKISKFINLLLHKLINL